MMNNRGGAGRGRGGSMYSGGRGGSQSGNQLKSHGSRGNFGGGRDYGNRDHGNRRGGSFVGGGGGGHHQGVSGASFRGRGQNHSSHFRSGRHDGSSGSFGPRDGTMTSSGFMGNSSGGGKKDENRRNFTDFKIVGLEIQDLSWTWGIIPTSKSEIKSEAVTDLPSLPSAGSEDTGGQAISQQITTESAEPSSPSINSQNHSDTTVVKGEGEHDLKASPITEAHTLVPEEHSTSEMPAPSVIPPPPSRMRIYFHSPVTPDDSRPIPNGASFSLAGSDETGPRKGKRKKLEDDDGDLEEGRAPPPPPGGSRPERSMSVDRLERASTAPSAEPSVTETASEGDWLMAAIGEDEGDGEDEAVDPELRGNNDGGDYPAEPEYGELFVVSVGVCVGVGKRRAGIALLRRAPASTGVPAASVCGRFADFWLRCKGSFEDGVATQADDGEGGVRDMAEGQPSLMDGQALENVHEAPSVDSLATTQAVGVPETQDPASSLDTSGGSDMAVVTQLTVAPHPEQLDGAPSDPFEIPGSIDAQNELAPSVPPLEEGVFVISPSSSVPAVPDSSVLASSSSSDTSVAAPPTELAALDEEQPADNAHSPDVPAPAAQEESTTSSASIIERSLTQEDLSFGDPHGTGVEDTQDDRATQVQSDGPSSSSDTSTLLSRSTVSTYGELNRSPIKTEAQRGVRTPSANRLSISYAAGTKRLVINSEIVEKLKILRSDGRVEISLRVEKDDVNELNGIIVGSLT